VTQVLDEGFAEFVALAGLAPAVSGIARQEAACLCVAIILRRDLAHAAILSRRQQIEQRRGTCHSGKFEQRRHADDHDDAGDAAGCCKKQTSRRCERHAVNAGIVPSHGHGASRPWGWVSRRCARPV
jgi:hypothetical protein